MRCNARKIFSSWGQSSLFLLPFDPLLPVIHNWWRTYTTQISRGASDAHHGSCLRAHVYGSFPGPLVLILQCYWASVCHTGPSFLFCYFTAISFDASKMSRRRKPWRISVDCGISKSNPGHWGLAISSSSPPGIVCKGAYTRVLAGMRPATYLQLVLELHIPPPNNR